MLELMASSQWLPSTTHFMASKMRKIMGRMHEELFTRTVTCRKAASFASGRLAADLRSLIATRNAIMCGTAIAKGITESCGE